MSSLEKKFPEACVVDGVNQSSEKVKDDIIASVEAGNHMTILNLPPKGSANDMKVKAWDQIILTPEWQQKARDAKIKYETEWFVIGQIKKDSDGHPESYNLSGSMGGGWTNINWNQPNVIASIFGNMMG